MSVGVSVLTSATAGRAVRPVKIFPTEFPLPHVRAVLTWDGVLKLQTWIFALIQELKADNKYVASLVKVSLFI